MDIGQPALGSQCVNHEREEVNGDGSVPADPRRLRHEPSFKNTPDPPFLDAKPIGHVTGRFVMHAALSVVNQLTSEGSLRWVTGDGTVGANADFMPTIRIF